MRVVNKKKILIYIILIMYFIVNAVIGFTSFAYIYVRFLNPLFLFLISVLFYYLTKDVHGNDRNKYLKMKTIIMIMVGYCLLYYLSGLLFSFVDNKNSLTSINLVNNFISSFIVVIFKEYVRYKMIYFDKKKLNLILITILFILLDINYLLFSKDIVFYILDRFISIMIVNITSTYLIYKLDYRVNFIYRGVLSAITLFLPVLPNHDWIIANVFLVGLLIVFIYSIDYLEILEDRRNKKRKIKKNIFVINSFFWIIVLLFVIFVVGAFKYQPIAIMSNSMEDYFSKGDVVVIEKLEQNNICSLEVGDVIYYKHEDKFITHRIFDKDVNGDSCVFNTKGDNNDSVDDWIVEKIDVVGVIKFKIKYIGWPSVLLYEALS